MAEGGTCGMLERRADIGFNDGLLEDVGSRLGCKLGFEFGLYEGCHNNKVCAGRHEC